MIVRPDPQRHEFVEANGRRAVIRMHSSRKSAVIGRYDLNGTFERVDLTPENIDDVLVWLMYYKKYLEEQSG